MVNYHVHDGDNRLETAVRLAKERAPDRHVQSFTDGSDGIVAVGGIRLVINVRYRRYDVYDETGVVGKYTDWEAALAKYASVLERREFGGSASETATGHNRAPTENPCE